MSVEAFAERRDVRGVAWMTPDEARATVGAIRDNLEHARRLVLDLHERRGWAALGYGSWEACVSSEFGRHRSTLFRYLQAARIERNLDGASRNVATTHQLVALAPLAAEEQPVVWAKAVRTAPDGKPNLADLRRLVKARQEEVKAERAAIPPAPKPEPLLPISARLEVASATALPLADNSVDLIVTSPPYGLDVAYDSADDLAERWPAALYDWLLEAYRVAREGGRLALNVPFDTTRGGHRATHPQAVMAAEAAGWTYRSAVVWAEGNVNKSIARGSVDSPSAPSIIAPVETVSLFSKGAWGWEPRGAGDIDHDDWLEWTNGLWTFPGESRPWEGHPAPFPEELPRRLITLLSYPGDTVLDPFLGSGTTALVAWRLGRKAIGVDVSEAYVASARRRLAAAWLSTDERAREGL